MSPSIILPPIDLPIIPPQIDHTEIQPLARFFQLLLLFIFSPLHLQIHFQQLVMLDTYF